MDAESLLANFETLADAPGGVGRLRELILQLAVQGKLVRQDPGDEPVSDLLPRIGETETVSSPMAISQGRYALPESWAWAQLGGISSYIQRGKGPSYAAKSEVPVVSQKCIQWSGFSLALARYVEPESLSKYKPERYLQTGDLLWNSTGTGTIGRVNIYPDLSAHWPRVVADSHVTVLRLVEIDPRFIWCWLASPLVQGEIDEISTGTTKQKELGTGTVKEYLVPLPPLAEQRRIVAKVDELMALCDELEARQEGRHAVRRSLQTATLEALSSADSPDAVAEAWDRVRANWGALTAHPDSVPPLRQAIIQLAVQGKLVRQDPGDEPVSDLLPRIGETETVSSPMAISQGRYALPESWAWAQLGGISSYIQRGKGPSYAAKSEVPVVSQKCIQWSGFSLALARYVEPESLSKYKPERYLQTGDLLWNSTGTGTIGRVNIYPDLSAHWPRVVADSHVTVLRLVEIDPRFIWCWLASPLVQGEIDEISTGTTKQKELGTGTVKEYLVPLPPLAEQRRIVAKVDELMALCDELEDKLQAELETSARYASAAAHTTTL